MSKTQKIFVLNFITNYLPVFLTAFVYVPFGNIVVPYLEVLLHSFIPRKHFSQGFKSDPDRLRNEVIALTVTGQIYSAFDEVIVPLVIRKAKTWYREYQTKSRSQKLVGVRKSAIQDDPKESEFLTRARNQAALDQYNVQEDYLEMVIQFGHLALFSPVWPLVPIGFLINNWIELRSDFLKISIEHQRPAPTRVDSIGPWIDSLAFLTWLGSISTAAIVHLFGTSMDYSGKSWTGGSWWTLPLTIFISEHIFFLVKASVCAILVRIGSDQIRREKNERYIMRRRFLDELEESNKEARGLNVEERERRKSVLILGEDSFWTKQVDDDASLDTGAAIISALKTTKEHNGQGHDKLE
jgi:anoctamin-10